MNEMVETATRDDRRDRQKERDFFSFKCMKKKSNKNYINCIKVGNRFLSITPNRPKYKKELNY